MGQGKTMLVREGPSSMLHPCIDGAAILLLLPKAVLPRILETPGSMCSLPCTLQREKRHAPARTRVWAVSHYTGICLSVSGRGAGFCTALSYENPCLPEFTVECGMNMSWGVAVPEMTL